TGSFADVLSLKPANLPTDAGIQNPTFTHPMMKYSYLNIESMLMVNNRGGLTDGSTKSRPIFVLGRLNYDAFTNTSLVTLSYAHATTCATNLFFFGKVRGYFSAGVTARMNGEAMMPEGNALGNMGARVGYNVYNDHSALQCESYVFQDQVVVNVTAHRKVGKVILVNGGVDNNRPKVGFSAMLGEKTRVSASSRYHSSGNVQAGASLSMNF